MISRIYNLAKYFDCAKINNILGVCNILIIQPLFIQKISWIKMGLLDSQYSQGIVIAKIPSNQL